MGGYILISLGLVMLAVVIHVPPVAARSPSDGFSEAFFNNVTIPGEMNDLWNRSFDRCKAAGQRAVDDCVIHRDANAVSHGQLTSPHCVSASNLFAKHYCIVLGSIAADLVAKFGVETEEGFINAHGDNFDHAIDSAGTEVWATLNKKCASSDASGGCLEDEVSLRLQIKAAEYIDCKSITDTHRRVDCLIAHWVASQVGEGAALENVGITGDYFYNPRVKSTLNDLALHGREKCDRAGAAVGSGCLIDSVAAVLPHGKEVTPYCKDIGDFVDRYLCVLTDALASDLYVKIGVGTADAFLEDYGKEGERSIDQAGAAVVGFLAGKCPETTVVPRCGPKEAATRLETEPKAIRFCEALTDDRETINCLLADRVIKVLLAAESQL